MTVTELIVFPASQAYLDDKSVLHDVLKIVKEKEGYIRSWHGLQVEDPTKGYLALEWETYEHHKMLMDAPDYYIIVDALKPALGGDIEMYHIPFSEPPSKSLSAPIIEIAFIPLRTGQPKDKLSEALISLCTLLDKAPGCHPPTTWGYTIEKEDTAILFVGWDSVEAHLEAVKAGSLKGTIDSIAQYANVSYKHGKLIGF